MARESNRRAEKKDWNMKTRIYRALDKQRRKRERAAGPRNHWFTKDA